MSDLISRSKVISVLKQLEEHSLSGKMDISNAIYLLKNQPTAYDIDKVVEELEQHYDDDSVICGLVYNDAIKKAIEIVKQGGLDDDVCEWTLTDTRKVMPYKTSCGNEDLYDHRWKFCPYCVKKIKVVE